MLLTTHTHTHTPSMLLTTHTKHAAYSTHTEHADLLTKETVNPTMPHLATLSHNSPVHLGPARSKFKPHLFENNTPASITFQRTAGLK